MRSEIPDDMGVIHEVMRLRGPGLIALHLPQSDFEAMKDSVQTRGEFLGEPILVVTEKSEQVYVPSSSKFLNEFFPDQMQGVWGDVVARKNKSAADFSNPSEQRYTLQVSEHADQDMILRRMIQLKRDGLDIHLDRDGMKKRIRHGRVAPKVQLYNVLDDAPRLEID